MKKTKTKKVQVDVEEEVFECDVTGREVGKMVGNILAEVAEGFVTFRPIFHLPSIPPATNPRREFDPDVVYTLTLDEYRTLLGDNFIPDSMMKHYDAE